MYMLEFEKAVLKRELRAYYAYLQYLSINVERGVNFAPDGTDARKEITIVNNTIRELKELIK